MSKLSLGNGDPVMTKQCTCKAEHWQYHADSCPAKTERPLLTLENIRSGAVPSDAVAVGFLLGEIERLQHNQCNCCPPEDPPSKSSLEPNCDGVSRPAAAALATESTEQAAPTETVYRKWPGEPPHCMSCDCGMTEEQKLTVSMEDYMDLHRACMEIAYEGISIDRARYLTKRALRHERSSERTTG